jgi:uncharacterized membrane protein YphA (DoxX/SURF4 family)
VRSAEAAAWAKRLIDDDPRTRPLSRWLVSAALVVPCIYHGVWNLSDAGAAWWLTDSGLPPALRLLIGAAELAAAVALVSGVLSRLAAAGLAIIFLGAIPQHVAHGFSFKNGGWEPLFVDLLLALAIAVGAFAEKPQAVRKQ